MSVKDPAMDRTIGRRLEGRRKALGMTQRELEARTAIGQNRLCEYEGGKAMRASTLFRAAKALDVPMAFFFPNE